MAMDSVHEVEALAERHGVAAGSINPNVFQDQIYKHGSLGNPDPARPPHRAAAHPRLASKSPQRLGQPRSLAVVRRRLQLSRHRQHPPAQQWFEEGSAKRTPPAAGPAHAGRVQALRAGLLSHRHRRLGHGAAHGANRRPAGQGAGRHRPSLPGAEHRTDRRLAASENMLGGFHFNDRRYADDDLTLGSIDPYQVFRIFHEIALLRVGDRRARRHRLHDRSEPQPERQDRSDDPDRVTAQELYAKAALVDHDRAGRDIKPRPLWSTPKSACRTPSPPTCGPAIREWRRSKGLPKTRCRRFAKAAIWSERFANAPSATLQP